MDRLPRETHELRKIRKPLMEKKRRQRINNSLEYLKRVLLQNTVAISTSGGRVAKLEKADILEMTVRYIQTLHQQLNIDTEHSSRNSDRARFPIVSSTTPDSIVKFNRLQQSSLNLPLKLRADLHPNLIKAVNRPVSINKTSVGRGLNEAKSEGLNEFKSNSKGKIRAFISPMQNNAERGQDKENLVPDCLKFKEDENNNSPRGYHWRPW